MLLDQQRKKQHSKFKLQNPFSMSSFVVFFENDRFVFLLVYCLYSFLFQLLVFVFLIFVYFLVLLLYFICIFVENTKTIQ